MVWDGSANGGFTGGNVKPWLPVKAPQLARNVASQQGVAGSVLETYRSMLAFRRGSKALIEGHTQFFDLPEPILGFTRGDDLLCLFNLSPDPVSVSVAGVGAMVGPSQSAKLASGKVNMGGNGFAFLTVTGAVTVA
jgi:alpha-glucosidase